MKSLTKVLTSIALLSFTIFSCDQENEISSTNRLSVLTKQTLSSSKFLNLDIPLTKLNANASQYVNNEEKSIFIPFNGLDDRNGIIAIFNKANMLLEVAEYQAITIVSADQVYSELRNGNFKGTFVFRLESGEIRLNMEKSKIISKVEKTVTSGRTSACNGFTQPGGALDCAGQRLENMNWVDATICYASFVPCMAQLIISCMVDKCAIQ